MMTRRKRKVNTMPTYDYECGGCGHQFELFQSITESPIRKCPECGSLKAKRQIGTGGAVIFKILRSAADARWRGKVCIVGRNPDAIWFDGYDDRVLFDEAGLFDYSRVKSLAQTV